MQFQILGKLSNAADSLSVSSDNMKKRSQAIGNFAQAGESFKICLDLVEANPSFENISSLEKAFYPLKSATAFNYLSASEKNDVKAVIREFIDELEKIMQTLEKGGKQWLRLVSLQDNLRELIKPPNRKIREMPPSSSEWK